MDIIVIILLLLLGLLLIVIEAFLPGGIVGFFGVSTIVGSAILCYSKFGTLWGSVYLVLCMFLGVAVGISAFLLVARRLSLAPPEATRDESEPDERIGATGRVIKTLNPTGYVEIDGRRLLARTRSSEISVAEGVEVVVKSMDSSYMVVEANAEQSESEGDLL